MTKCGQDFFDSNLQDFNTPCSGKTVEIRSSKVSRRCVYEIRFYQTPNLLNKLQGTVTISATAPPTNPKNSIDNLINNLHSRVVRTNFRAFIDEAGNTATHRNCYSTGRDFMESLGHVNVIQLDFN